MTPDKEYLRAADIARLTGMSIRTIRRWIAEKIIPSSRVGGARLVPRAGLEHALSPLPARTQTYTNDDEELRRESTMTHVIGKT